MLASTQIEERVYSTEGRVASSNGALAPKQLHEPESRCSPPAGHTLQSRPLQLVKIVQAAVGGENEQLPTKLRPEMPVVVQIAEGVAGLNYLPGGIEHVLKQTQPI
jgi:hypothetical protein